MAVLLLVVPLSFSSPEAAQLCDYKHGLSPGYTENASIFILIPLYGASAWTHGLLEVTIYLGFVFLPASYSVPLYCILQS